MNHSSAAVASEEAQRDLTQVYNIRGGWESDLVLHPKAEECVRGVLRDSHSDRFKSVLDVGAGRGGFTSRLARVSEKLLVTDYMPEHVDHSTGVVQRLVEKEGLSLDLSSQRLDVSGDLVEQLEVAENARSFDLITCLSVLMKLQAEQSEKAIQQMYDLLVPGGSLFIATISYSAASSVYTPAPWLGSEDAYIPRYPKIKRHEMTSEVLSKITSNPMSLAEFYPCDSHYYESAHKTGGDVVAFSFLADKRCLKAKNQRTPSIYSKIAKSEEELWFCVRVTKPL